jgi:glutamyl-tRNA synthetase
VGGARTALFNWALAKALGGRFLLRIEDTDRARSSDEAVSGILEALAWLGIAWDDGPERGALGGDPRNVGPFFQSQRLARYDAAIGALIERDLAYPAFDTPEELEQMRAAAREAKRNFRYRRAPDYDAQAARERMTEPHVVRFRMPTEPIHVTDVILGGIDFTEEHLDDFVIRKRDGFPTYHLAMVIDDHEMGVTHVLRGQEHVNNTPRHVALQRALSLPEPHYLHVPLIFNADGSKMSKRDKDKVARAAYKEQSFRRAGYLPETLCNYLGLLGFSPGEKDSEGRDRERFDRDYLADRFEASRIGHSNARFDRAKLLAFSGDDIAALSDEAFWGLWDAWCTRYAPWVGERFDEETRKRIALALKSRCKTLADITSPSGPGAFLLLADDEILYDEKAVSKHLRKGEPDGFSVLEAVREALGSLADFSPEAIEEAVRVFSEERGLGMGKVAQPLRVAVTGSAASPPLGDTLSLLGSESVSRRIARCLAECR